MSKKYDDTTETSAKMNVPAFTAAATAKNVTNPQNPSALRSHPVWGSTCNVITSIQQKHGQATVKFAAFTADPAGTVRFASL